MLVDTTGFPAHYDMYLMSLCKKNIIANSTFSWWAAYLNYHENKEVFCPSDWFNDKQTYTDDLYPPEWKVININSVD